MVKSPALLVIMDGLGWAEPSEANAVTLAHTPNLDALWDAYPHTTIEASGKAVGLPEGQMGNSEVGHLNLGAGRVVMQELMRIDTAIEDGSFLTNEVLLETANSVAKNSGTLHLMGLLSNGGVHSHIRHLMALMELAAEQHVERVRIHAFLDGRDVDPGSALMYLQEITALAANISEVSGECDIRIGSVCGRYYAMDRDNRWDRVKRAWDAIVLGRGTAVAPPLKGVEDSYAQDITDEFVVPFACEETGIVDGDAVIFFNFRPDRARQLSRAFTEPDFDGFDRGRVPDVRFVCMTEYDPTLNAQVAFAKSNPEHVLADVYAERGLRQYHTAETEKYAHVTFFFNGGVEEPKKGETRKLIASPKVATYDLQPQMSEPEVAETLAAAIRSDAADLYIVNFANPDMVGHTGVLEAAIAAIEATDSGVGMLVDAIKEKQGVALITADHGNADCMFTIDDTGARKPMTAHTTARVPFIVVCDDVQIKEGAQGRLCDVAPTLLDIVGIEKPSEWTGVSLIEHL